MKICDLSNYIIQLEDNARLSYLKFSEICIGRLKDVLLIFSEEEDNHKEIIHNILGNIGKDIDVIPENILSIMKNQKLFYAAIEEDASKIKDKEFFLFALESEKSSIELYSQILDKLEEDSYEYSVFQNLIEEEKKHMLFILKRLHELK